MPIGNVSSSPQPQHQPASARSTRRKGVTKQSTEGGFTQSLTPDQEAIIVGALLSAASVGPTIYDNSTDASKKLFNNIDTPLTFSFTIASLFWGASKDRRTARKRGQAEKAAQTAKKQAGLQEQKQLDTQNIQRKMDKAQIGKQKKHEVIQMAMLPLISTAILATCIYAWAANNCISTPDQSKDCKALGFMALASLVSTVFTALLVFDKVITDK